MIEQVVIFQFDLVSKVRKVLRRLLEGISLVGIQEHFFHLEHTVFHVFEDSWGFLAHSLARIFEDLDRLWFGLSVCKAGL